MSQRKKILESMTEVKERMDLTPMVDLVFNLIIFFLVVSNMVAVERTELQLPIADQAKEDKSSADDVLIINVQEDGKIDVAGSFINEKQLADLLEKEAKASKEADGSSSRRVVIRGDTRVSYENIQTIMLTCAKNKIYKISFSATPEKK